MEGFLLLLGQAMAVAGSLAGVRLLTELLDPRAYGELALGMTLASLVNQTILGPLCNGVIRFYAPAMERGELGGYLEAVRRLMLSANILLAFLLLLGIFGLVIAGETRLITIAVAALLLSLFSGLNSIFGGMQNAARHRSVVALHQGVEPWVRFLAAAGLIILLGATSTMAMIGYALALLLVITSQYIFFRREFPRRVKEAESGREWCEKIYAYSWPFSIFGVFTWLQLASDRWALNAFSSTQEVGMYAALFQLGYYPMSIATGVALQLLVPILFQRAGDGTDSRRLISAHQLGSRLVWIGLALTGVATLVAFCFHAQIFSIFAAREYGGVSYLLPWMLLAGGVFAAGQTMTLSLMSQLKTRSIMVGKVVTAVVGIVSNIVGAYCYGTSGIVAAGVFFSLVYFLWMTVVSRIDSARVI
jgi:O-antigen/teichoic acid export membrane protein